MTILGEVARMTLKPHEHQREVRKRARPLAPIRALELRRWQARATATAFGSTAGGLPPASGRGRGRG
jgi:hypothetical protein